MPYYPYSPSVYHPETYQEPATTSVPTGTFLHKGFYDLLAMIPTPSPSRLLWKAPSHPLILDGFVAGPRYEHQESNIKSVPKKGRRVSKDMVSSPTGFV